MESKRNFLRGLLTAGILALIAPFTPVIQFFYRKEASESQRQRIGNLEDLKPGSYILFSYPKTGDPKVDNDPFRQYIVLRTLDGEIRAYSRVCVHLWCLPPYIPEKRQLVCPCHGSVYRDIDGVAIAGPAFYQPYPQNALPMAVIEIDEKGDMYVVGVDGRIGFGREWKNKPPESNVIRKG